VLPREGHRTIGYDARGHGESDPGPRGAYNHEHLALDLAAVIEAEAGGERPVVAGSSMGAHTALAYALQHAEHLAGIVVIGPAYAGEPPAAEAIERWERLAGGLERDGVEGFLRAYEAPGLDPEWRETLIRTTRARLETHRHPAAVAEAMREVPRSRPFGSLDRLASLDLPALVVASHDEADPGHPYALAQAYAERLPRARLVGEERGESPLAWQGGRLSREIARFCAEEAVRERQLG
jgi:pimeloyl-ACP methyl ester carboxylesterase